MEFTSLTEKVAYLKGLMEGLDRNDKVIALIADILGDMAHEIEEIQCDIEDIEDVVDTLDEDLGEIESDFYEMDEDDDDCDFDECCCDDEDDDEELFDDEELYEVTCPTCSDTICLNEAMIEEGSISCPNCGELLEFDLDDMESDSEEE